MLQLQPLSPVCQLCPPEVMAHQLEDHLVDTGMFRRVPGLFQTLSRPLIVHKQPDLPQSLASYMEGLPGLLQSHRILEDCLVLGPLEAPDGRLVWDIRRFSRPHLPSIAPRRAKGFITTATLDID